MAVRFRLPWLVGLKRPNFVFYKLKISVPTSVPSWLIFGLIYFSILYIYVGGVYNLVEHPYARGADSSGNPIIIMPNQDRQFLIEGIVAGIMMFVGAVGLYLLAQATSDPHNPGRAVSYQSMGVVLLFLAFIILQSMYSCKLSSTNC